MECASACLANPQCTGFGYNTTTGTCSLGGQATYYSNNKTTTLSYAPAELISNTMREFAQVLPLALEDISTYFQQYL
jgi:hypothetical protein